MHRSSGRRKVRVSVRAKLYALGLPLVALAGLGAFASLVTYESTQARIHDARADIEGSLAAQRLEREFDELVWQLGRSVVKREIDGDHLANIRHSQHAAADALETWRRRADGSRMRKRLDDVASSKATLDRLANEVVTAARSNDFELASDIYFDEVLEEYDDGIDDSLDEIVAEENVNIREAFIRLGGDAGRLEGFGAGSLTSRINETSGDVAQAQNGANFLEGLTTASLEMLSFIARGEPALDEVVDEHADTGRLLNTWGRSFESRVGEDDEVDRIQEVLADFTALGRVQDRALDRLGSDGKSAAERLVGAEYDRVLHDIVADTEAMIRSEERDIATTIQSVVTTARRTNLVTTLVMSGLFLLAGLFVVSLARRLARRLSELKAAAERVETGDLSVRVEPSGADEISALGNTFNSMASALETARRQSDALMAKTVDAAERERTGLAADLHDGPVQRLTALGYDLERSSMRIAQGDVDAAGELVATAKAKLSAEVRQLRQMMVELRPPALDEQGLAAALNDYVTEFGQREGIRVSMQMDTDDRLPPVIETTVYRVTQEALTNIAKHARASSVDVRVDRTGGGVRLRVQDDGEGFNVAKSKSPSWEHFGLDGMEQRVKLAGGDWQIDSSPTRGTTVIARLPITAEAA